MTAKRTSKVLAALLSAVMAISVGGGYFPAGSITAEAAETAESYTYESYDGEYDITSESVTISSAGTYRVYGNSTSTSNTITVSSSEDVVLVIDNVIISSSGCCIGIKSTGKTTLVLKGTNSLTSSGNPGIFKDTSSGELIIAAWGNDNSAGSLTAKSIHSYSSGIGGYYGSTSGITINSGTITVAGGDYGAGIGGGRSGNGSSITISGGTVTATSSNGAGIGSGYSNSASSGIKIYNSSVKASSISVTPTNADGDSVYLYTIPDTTEGDSIIVDGETYIESITHHTSSDKNQYIYLTSDSAEAQTGSYIYSLSYSESSGTSVTLSNIAASSSEDLVTFLNLVNTGNTSLNCTLTADVDMTGVDWTPIDTSSNPYAGTFDGQGHIIKNLTFDDDTQDYAGLFGYTAKAAAIKNVGVVGNITGYSSVGGICGFLESTGTISNCYFEGSVSGNTLVGGICGNCNGNVENCYNSAAVYGSYNNVGGICGYTIGNVNNCYNTGSISSGNSSAAIGGIVGYNFMGTHSNNYYLEGTAGKGVGTNSGSGGGTDISASFISAQLSSGELTWLLSGEAEGTDWLQTLGTDTKPCLSVFSSESLPVVKLTRNDDGSEVYANVVSDGISVIDNGSALSGIAVDTTAYGGSGEAYLDKLGAVVDGTFYPLNNYYYIDENGAETDSSNSAYFPVLGKSEKTDASVRGAVAAKATADSNDILYFVTSATTGLTINAAE